MKITMLGRSGSGKTTFMSALYEVLTVSDFHGFHLSEKAESFRDGIIKYGRISELSFYDRMLSFPEGTVQTTAWEFDLMYLNRLAVSFEWIDYRGGLLDNIINPRFAESSETTQQFHELLTHISDSDAVMVFLDSLVLANYTPKNVRLRHSGAQAIVTILRNFAIHFPHKPLNVVVLLTKADSDQLDRQYKDDNFRELLKLGKEPFETLLSGCASEGVPWQAGIAAVGAVGEGNVISKVTKPQNGIEPILVESKIINYPEPFRVGESLFYCIGLVLRQLERAAREDIAKEAIILEKALQQNASMARAFAVIKGEKDPKVVVREAYRRRQEDFQLLAEIRDNIYSIEKLAAGKVCAL